MPKYLTPNEIKLRDRMFQEGKLFCTNCKKFLSHQKFGVNNRKRDSNYGFTYWCTFCKQEKDRKYNRRTREKRVNRYRSLKIKYIKLAGAKCQKCGYDESFAALHFHHVNPIEKSNTPVTVVNSNDEKRTISELDKCCLLCANCHQSFDVTWTGTFKKRDGLGYTVQSFNTLSIPMLELPKSKSNIQQQELFTIG